MNSKRAKIRQVLLFKYRRILESEYKHFSWAEEGRYKVSLFFTFLLVKLRAKDLISRSKREFFIMQYIVIFQ